MKDLLEALAGSFLGSGKYIVGAHWKCLGEMLPMSTSTTICVDNMKQNIEIMHETVLMKAKIGIVGWSVEIGIGLALPSLTRIQWFKGVGT